MIFPDTTGMSFVLGTTQSDGDSLSSKKQLALAYSNDNAASFKMANLPVINQTPRSIATSGSDYVVVGDAGTLLHSSDGINWTQIDVSQYTSSDLTNVEYLNGKYYVVGDLGYVLSSTNGVNWLSSQVSANPRLMDITYSNGKYFVVGFGGYIAYSSNASNWIKATTPNKNQINAIVYGNNMYVAVGAAGTLITSTNGQQWSVVPQDNIKCSSGSSCQGLTKTLHSVLYDAQDGFVAVGDSGLVLKSSDGITWLIDAPSTYDYTGITSLN
jgi:photosystem II stability/assembly factor-like uncharacterized protein